MGKRRSATRRKRKGNPTRSKAPRTAQELCRQAAVDYDNGEYERAVARLCRALQIRPRVRDAHFLLGACYFKLGRLEEAAQEAEAELRMHPDHALAWSLLGQVQMSQGRTAEALEALERAHEIDPHDVEIARHLHRARLRAFEEERKEVSVPDTAPKEWPSISVCMIVRDEEETLGRCLDSLGDLASQIVVVDTGSQDRTVEIARAYGAEVHYFEWIDDFSAARNESLRHARGEWILWLDADDELSPRAVAQIKYAVASGWADAYTLRVVSHLPDGAQDIGFHTRLFRNGLGIRFYGRIHESVYPDLVAKGLRSLDTDITVVHHGYEEDPEVLKRKHARNLPYLEKELERHPDNASLWCYVGLAKLSLGDEVGGEEALRRVVEDEPMGLYFDQYRFWAWASLLRLYMQREDESVLRETLDQALQEFPEHPYLLAVAGEAAVKRGDFAAALELFTQAYERWDASTYGLRPNRRLLTLQVATCRILLGRPEGDAWLERAGDLPQREFEEYLRWLVTIGRHRDVGITRVLEAVLRHWPEHPAVWKGLALVYEQQGSRVAAYGAWVRAVEHGVPKEEAAPHMSTLAANKTNGTSLDGEQGEDRSLVLLGRGMLHMQTGRFVEAAESFAKLIEADPQDLQAYRYLAVALQKMGREDDAIDVWRMAKSLASGG
ncbi:MAG: tetratricopeptide repeat protein [Chloroflexi bacterium]|nr:tetratricopeptide repeat protein [Chloroflexota bacterium]